MKKSKAREARNAAKVAVPGGSGDAQETPATGTVDTQETDALDRAEEVSRAATELAEIAEAMYKAAVTRGDIAEAREKALTDLAAAAEARDRALTERDAIANSRDRAAADRDTIANSRDKAAAEREAIVGAPRVAGRGAEVAEADGEDRALEKARLEAELQRAHLDALTGAFRREMGRQALRNEIERARRTNGKFVIAFVDVDGLKGVNDRDGHAAGDRVLRTLAATLRANLRSYDPIVRFGGDEFICGIASIDADEVQHRIGVIDQSLRQATGVGITAGLATLTSNESLEELTAKADTALIEAKRSRGE